MALKAIDPVRTYLANLDLDLIERSNIRQQKAYDDVAALQAEQLAKAGAQATLDPYAKELALEQQRKAYDDLFVRAQGNLGRYSADFARQAATNVAHEFNSLNKLQMEEFNKERELVGKYGDKAIRLSNVGGQSLINPETKEFLRTPDERAKLMSNVVEASDYTAKALELGKFIEKNSIEGGLFANKHWAHILSRKTIKDLSERELLAFVNDPSVQEAFLQSTTASYDNRRQVMDPATGKNIFNLLPEDHSQNLDERFNSGTAQFLFGALKQKTVGKTVSYKDRDDQLELFNAKLAAKGKAEDAKLRRGITSNFATSLSKGKQTFGEALSFDEKGNLKKPIASKNAKSPDDKLWMSKYMIGGGHDLGYYNYFANDAYMLSMYQDAINKITKFRQMYPEFENSSDREVRDLISMSQKNMQSVKRREFTPYEDYRKNIGEELTRNLVGKRASVGGRVYNLGSATDQEEFAKLFGKNNLEELITDENINFAGRVAQISPVSPLDADVGAGAVEFQLPVEGGFFGKDKQVSVYIEQDDEIQKAGQHLNDIYQNMGKSPIIVNEVPGVPNQLYSTIYGIKADGPVEERGFEPRTFQHGSKIYFKDPDGGDPQIIDMIGMATSDASRRATLNKINRKAKKYAKKEGITIEEAVQELTNGSLAYVSMEALEERTYDNVIYKPGVKYAGKAVHVEKSSLADSDKSLMP